MKRLKLPTTNISTSDIPTSDIPTVDSKTPQLEVVLRGGLGNQLYQWAYSELVSEHIPVRVVFDSSIVNLGGIHWGQQLTDLIPNVDVSDRHKRPITHLMSKPAWSIARYYQWFYPRWETLRYSSPNRAISRLQQGRNARVSDPCFFIADFFDHPEIAAKVQGYLNSLHPITEPHSAMHIRRGDYLQQWARALLTEQFYVTAAGKLPKDLPVWIVSDDKEFAGAVADRLTEQGMEALVVSGPDHYYDLAVLATASALLLSTSTYSWWGAYLASSLNNAAVYYPSPWSPDWSTERIGWASPNWIGIKRDSNI